MVLDGIPLLDHHCHGVVDADLDRPTFESLLSEAPASPGRNRFGSLLGLAVRRWCAPVLDLEPHAEPDAYLARRAELGWAQASRRLLRASGVREWLVDTGYAAGSLTDPAELAELGGGRAARVCRVETVAELAGPSLTAAGWSDGVERALRAEAEGAVGLKTVVAYRTGLALPEAPPTTADVVRAAGQWLRRRGRRIDDPVLGGWLVHLGVRLSAELGLPLQVHTGFGDPDVRLPRANPALLSDLLATTERTGARFMLLHCWPYQRDAGYLAHVFSHVFVDVGLAVPYVGVRAREVLAELLELAPFRSVCFSSDGYGLAELHFLGALLWRRALAQLLDEWIAEDALTAADAERLSAAMAFHNAARAYSIPAPSGEPTPS
ncbi:MAG: amidohydrolase family protein [Pseudonocardia sp.]|nr:amidohydrolase family protein [Pseudonocardia sp.]